MTLNELRKIAESATPGEWEDRAWQESRFYSEQEQLDCKYVAAFSPTRILAMLRVIEAAVEMRESRGAEFEAFDKAIEEMK